MEEDLATGQPRNPDVLGRPEFFTTTTSTGQKSSAEAIAAGLSNVRMLAIEEPSWILEDSDDLENQLFAARAVE